MPTSRKRRRATYEDLLALPDDVIGELIDGEIHASPRPANLHTLATSSLFGFVHRFHTGGGGPGGWWIVFEPELHLGSSVLVPDLAGWRVARMPVYPLEPYFTLAPDWICEVLSPGTARLDIHLKLPRYGHAGVGHAWLLDPTNKTLQVFRREDDAWLVVAGFGDGDTVRAEPFVELEFELGALWPMHAREREPSYPAPTRSKRTKRSTAKPSRAAARERRKP